VVFNERIPEAPGLFDPYHIGLATDRPWRVERVVPVSRSQPAFMRTEAAARKLFAAADRGAIRIESGYGAPFEPLRTQRFREAPVVVDALFVSGQGRHLTYYFEASRWLPEDGARVFIAGWIVQGVGPPRTIINAAYAWPEGGPAPSTVDEWLTVANSIPLGVVWMPDGPVWVMETPLGEATAFALYQLGRTSYRTLMLTDGGGC
jgi:hypothetical protein